MTTLLKQSNAYLSQVCGLTNPILVQESEEKITFKVPQNDFITSFRSMEKQFGQFKAYPVDTDPSISQIDAVWTVGIGQHIIYVTELTDNQPQFFVSLLNASAYTPGTLATKLEKTKKGVDALMQTSEWENIGQNIFKDADLITGAAKRLGLL